jgi:hypothetical protein
VDSDSYFLLRLGLDLDFRPHNLEWRRRRSEANPFLPAPTLRDGLIAAWLRIRDKESRLIPFELNRAQAEYSKNCTYRNIVLKARQLGITTYVAARFFIQTITHAGVLTVQVAHNQESAEEIFRIVHRFWEKLPERVRKGALVTSRANIRQLVFPQLDSEYRVATAADANAGRGLTIQNLHCSEVARWPHGGAEALASLRAAVPPRGEIVLESTPNGAGGIFYEEWQRAAETGFTRHFFPWWYEDKYQLSEAEHPVVDLGRLSDEEEDLARRVGLSERQIAYRRLLRTNLRRLAAQEYAEDPISCFKASGECVFDLEAIEQRAQKLAPPAATEDNERLLIWFPAQEPHEYIIGVDPAGGGSDGDYACAQVIDRVTGMQCAELRGHYTPRELAKKISDLGALYNAALVAVERNNHGHAVLAHLRDVQCYPNIYTRRDGEGWLTSALSRPPMIENLAAVLITDPDLFQSARLLDELRTFVRHADGSSGAVAGAHDDCVMAMAIAFAVRQDVAGDHPHNIAMELVSLS